MSLHLGGIADSVTVIKPLFGPILLVLAPLIGWWRWWGHMMAQAIVATILTIAITVSAFWLLRLPMAFPC